MAKINLLDALNAMTETSAHCKVPIPKNELKLFIFIFLN